MKRLVMNYGSGFSRAAFTLLKIISLIRRTICKKARAFIDSDIRLTEFL